MSTSIRAYLHHILTETQSLISQSQASPKRHFLVMRPGKRAFVRSLEIIGEAAKQIPDAIRQQYPTSPGAP